VDKEAIELGAKAGIDLHGTNAGLIGEDEDFNTDEEHDMFDDAHVQGADKDQQSYIAELEERNMNLQEKVRVFVFTRLYGCVFLCPFVECHGE